MHIILHIGQHKTGSTTLQNALYRQKNDLLQKGYVYNVIEPWLKHTQLCNLFKEDPALAIKNLHQDIKKYEKTAHTYIISDEVFYVQPHNHCNGSWEYLKKINQKQYIEEKKNYIHTVFEACRGSKVKIVLYLRRQDLFADSLYKQLIRGNYFADRFEFLAHIEYFMDYFLQCSLWEETFGAENIFVRTYDKSQLVEQDIISDFQEVTGVPVFKNPEENKNISLKRDIAELKKIYNAYTDGSLDNKEILAILNLLSRSFPQAQGGYIFSPEERLGIIEKFASSNAAVAARYCRRDQLFIDALPYPQEPWRPFPALTQEETLAAFMSALQDSVRLNLRHEAALQQQIAFIKKSGEFDESFYRQTYLLGRREIYSPQEHYVKFGLAKRYNPNKDFDSFTHVKKYPELRECGVHPFIHHLLLRAAKRRELIPSPAEPSKSCAAHREKPICKGGVFWLTGLPGSGKTTLAQAAQVALSALGLRPTLLDGDVIRKTLNADLGFSIADRQENVRRIAAVAGILATAGHTCLVAAIAPLEVHRRQCRDMLGCDYHEIFLDCPLDICRARDVKGHYALAATGMIEEYTGVSSPYEPPERPDLILSTHLVNVEDCLSLLKDFILVRSLK